MRLESMGAGTNVVKGAYTSTPVIAAVESGKVSPAKSAIIESFACDDMNCTCTILIQTILYTVLVDQTD